MIFVSDVINAYKKTFAGRVNVSYPKLTDEEAQAAIRGITNSKADLEYFAKQDIVQYPNATHLQLKTEVDSPSYLIHLVFSEHNS